MQSSYEMFVGLLALILSLLVRNDETSGAGLLRRYRKQILMFGGLTIFTLGILSM